jgi:hypothetical protein
MITLKLAHPLTAEQADRLRARDVKEYPSPGMEITVPRDEARAIIDAGYAFGVDPQDQDAVAQVFEPEPTDTPPPDATRAAKADPGETKAGPKRATSS